MPGKHQSFKIDYVPTVKDVIDFLGKLDPDLPLVINDSYVSTLSIDSDFCHPYSYNSNNKIYDKYLQIYTWD